MRSTWLIQRSAGLQNVMRGCCRSFELVDVAPRVVGVFLAYRIHQKAREYDVDDLHVYHSNNHCMTTMWELAPKNVRRRSV